MINKNAARQYCNEDISLIENYNDAINDTENMWECHHKNEIEMGLTYKELKELNLYYDRPASELIFLHPTEHRRLHMEGRPLQDSVKEKLSKFWSGKRKSEEHKKKIGEANKKFYATHPEISEKLSKRFKGENNPMYGKSGTMLGKHHTEEARKKISKSAKGRFVGNVWWNNGIVCKFAKECPGEGFIRGRLKLKKR